MISEMRKVYQGKVLNFSIENLVAKEPFAQFKEWFKEACDAKDIQEPNAMAIATATRYMHSVHFYIYIYIYIHNFR